MCSVDQKVAFYRKEKQVRKHFVYFFSTETLPNLDIPKIKKKVFLDGMYVEY